jgi:hypothetical protein
MNYHTVVVNQKLAAILKRPEAKRRPTKTRRGGRDKNGCGHLTEAPKGQAGQHPFLSQATFGRTGPPEISSGVFLFFGGSNSELPHFVLDLCSFV